MCDLVLWYPYLSDIVEEKYGLLYIYFFFSLYPTNIRKHNFRTASFWSCTNIRTIQPAKGIFLPAAVAKNEVDLNAFLVGVFPTFLSYKKSLFQKDIYYVARVDYYSLVIHI